jgi:NCAIR mutase (PurE)-related protein
MVSGQPFTVQIKLYAPEEVNPVIVVLGDDGVAMFVVDGLLDCAVHVPTPTAAAVADVNWQTV